MRIQFLALLFLILFNSCSSSPIREPSSLNLRENCFEALSYFQDRYIKGLKESQILDGELTPINNRERSEVELSMKFSEVEGELTGIHRGAGSTDPTFYALDDGIKVVWKEHKKIKLSNYRAEVLAFELDRLWGFNLVPETVERSIDGGVGSVQLFKESITGPLLKYNIKNNMSEEAIARVQHNLSKQSMFDYLIENNDRNVNNYLFTLEGELYSIDNAASFTGIGFYQKSFAAREEDIKAFLSTDEGEAVFKNIVSSYDESFKKQIIEYIGKKDARRFFGRIERIIQVND